MTLGGLSLAVGILVDDATVEIENVHRNIGMNKPIVRAILDGAQQIATPAFVATLCICIVFIPVVFISGAAKSLFTPLAMAVVFAMMSSYFLSRTLVPTMVHYLLAKEMHLYQGAHAEGAAANGKAGPKLTPGAGFIWNAHERFNVHFERFRRLPTGAILDWALIQRQDGHHRLRRLRRALVRHPLPRPRQGLLPQRRRGADEVPRAHARRHAHRGHRAPAFALVEDEIRKVVPKKELATILDNIGVPVSGINLALGDPSMISSGDGEIYVSLNEEHGSTPRYVKELRARFAKQFPQYDIFFLAPDITTQVLNFGLSAPIDVQISGPLRQPEAEPGHRPGPHPAHREGARRRRRPHAAARRRAGDARSPSTASRRASRGSPSATSPTTCSCRSARAAQVTPNYWLDPKKGVQYLVAVQTPQYNVNSLHALEETPISWKEPSSEPQTLGNIWRRSPVTRRR